MRGTKSDNEISVWWAPVPYVHWDAIENDIEWLQTETDLPSVTEMVEVTNPDDGEQWLSLNFMVHPREPQPPGEDPFSRPRRGFWYMLKSYLVHCDDKEKFWQWAVQQDFMGRWMPESHELRDVFWGELFWAPSFLSQNEPYYGRSGWTRQEDEMRFGRGLPVPVLITVDTWVQDGRDYDCSLNESAHITIPCQELAKMMGLRPGREGEWLNERGQLIAFDPSTRTPGPSTLLVKKQNFLDFLNTDGYDVVWTLLGEKQISTMALDSPGILEISGALHLNNGHIECSKKSVFRELP